MNALRASVKYIARISTTAAKIRPEIPAYYACTHWAIETMLCQPEFKEMHWTSLQPNAFMSLALGATAGFIKEFKKTGKQGPLSIILDAGTPTSLIDPYDVGVVVAHLLAQENTIPHNEAKYVLNGPKDVTGKQIARMTEQYIGEPVEDVRFKDVAFVDQMVASSSESKYVLGSIKLAPVTIWEGKAKAETTSKKILDLYAPKRTASEMLMQLIEA